MEAADRLLEFPDTWGFDISHLDPPTSKDESYFFKDIGVDVIFKSLLLLHSLLTGYRVYVGM